MLLSLVAWIQLSFLSGYPKSAIYRALQGAVPQVLSHTPWDTALSLSSGLSILPLLPCDKSHVTKHLTTWLRIHAVWRYDAYTSIYPFRTSVTPIVPSGAMVTPSSNKCVAWPHEAKGGEWQIHCMCHSLKYRDRLWVHSDSLATTSVYRYHTM